MAETTKYSEIVAFILPLPEFIPFSGEQSFSYTNNEVEIEPSEVGSIILDERKFQQDAFPDGKHDFVFIRAFNATHVGLGKAATNVKMAEAILKRYAPELAGKKSEEKLTSDTHITTFVMHTPLLGNDEQAISRAFTKCLEFANKLLDAAGGARSEGFSALNEVNSPSIVLHLKRPISSAVWKELGMHLSPHMNDIRSDHPAVYTQEEMDRLGATLHGTVADQPAANYNRLRSAANKAHFRQGDFRTSLIMDYAAGEVLLNSTLMLLLWEKGVSADDASKYFLHPTRGLKSRISRHYAPLLGGGGWSFKGSGAAIQWYKTVALLRGRCVHSGYIPSHAEADNSHRLTNELQFFIANKLRAKKNQFPLTYAATFGTDRDLTGKIKVYNKWKNTLEGLIQGSE